MMLLYHKLYKIDTKGKTRVWWMEVDGDKYRTISGILDGKLVTTAWTVAEPKNVGRANATTAEEQAISEVISEYIYQEYQGGYSKDINNMGSKFFEPMLAHKYDVFVKKPTFPVFSQPKLDGVRCIATKDGLFSREGKPFVSVPHIYDQLKHVFDNKPELVFDGELYNHDFRDDFNKIISLVKKTKPTDDDLLESERLVGYCVYDVYDKNNPNMSYVDRFYGTWNHELYLDTTFKNIYPIATEECLDQDHLDNLYGLYLSQGFEGQMLRNNNPYENKRSKNLLKRKEFIDEEFEVVSISEGLGNWAGYAKSVRCRKKDGTEFDSGIKGSQEFTKELLTKTWKTVTVRYQNLTPDGIPRFPVAVAFYENERDI